jgi:hypothetical protein
MPASLKLPPDHYQQGQETRPLYPMVYGNWDSLTMVQGFDKQKDVNHIHGMTLSLVFTFNDPNCKFHEYSNLVI